ncbi:MAG: hypothetical protein R6U55_11465 [Desulfovermiculus sp.]
MRIRVSITVLMVLGMAFCLSGTAYPTTNELRMKPPNQELQLKRMMQINPEKTTLQREHQYPYAPRILLTDDLTEKSAQAWQLEPGWFFTQEEGMTLLKGQGRYWARLEEGREWSNYTLQARFKIIKGYVHFNALVDDNGRYIIGVGNKVAYLQKESPRGKIQGLAQNPVTLDPRQWHDIRIDIYRNKVLVSIDHKKVIAYTDKSPLQRGGIALESLRHSEVLIDKVSVYTVRDVYKSKIKNGAAYQNKLEVPSFKLPPPEASVWEVLPNELFLASAEASISLGDVDRILSEALEAQGYTSRAYYPLEREGKSVEGFALVTRMEQIYEDGTPKNVPHRWAAEVLPMEGFSLTRLIERLFSAEVGYFRIIVFVATPEFFAQGDPIEREAAMEWLKKGLNKLPPFIAQQAYTSAFNTTALVYQFKKYKGASEEQVEQIEGILTCREHLQRAGIWEVWRND